MADPIITKIGDVSAYLDAVAHGFEGTRAEFGELLANSANYAQSAGSAASAAIASAATATTKAGEATTAAIAAQTAKTQTEAAASQALTDIGTAMLGAISAVQTEGATQTANATAQAQAAATSATTASTKASEASTSATTATTKATEAAESATSAANSASAAQGVLDSIPEDYSDLSEDADQLKADLDQIFVQEVYEKDNSSPSKVFECTIVANTTYYVKNTGSVSVNVRTSTSDGTEVENIKNGITAGETVIFTATQNASYIRLYAVDVASIAISTNGDVLKREDVKIAEANTKIAEANTKIGYLNKATGLEWIIGSFINSSNGGTGNATDRACTGFIPCPELTSVSYVGENNKNTVYGIAFYDKYFKLISGDSNTSTIGNETTLTSPAGTRYARVSTLLSMLNSSYIKINDVRKNTLVNLSRIAINAPIYVNALNGNDISGTGSLIAPYKTINKAITAGAEIIGLFPTATYSETISISGRNLHMFTYTDSTSEFSDETPNRPKATISGGSTALTIQNAERVVLEGIIVTGCSGDGCLINKCQNVEVTACEFNLNGNNGIVCNYSDGVFRDCVAHDNTRDGFNLNYYGDTQFYNCSGYDNGDDGISHHQGCTGLIDGGEWYGNVKGGVASPCHGAKVDVMNVYSHDNGFGIYARAGIASTPAIGRTFRVWNCVLTNNSKYGLSVEKNSAIIYKNKISGNTEGQTAASVGGTITVLD